MGKVLTHMTMSLDGYVADPGDQVGELFDWYEAGEVSVPSFNDDIAFDLDEASAGTLHELTANVGALVSGRRLFDIADGWSDARTRAAPTWSWSPTAHRRMPPSGCHGRRMAVYVRPSHNLVPLRLLTPCRPWRSRWCSHWHPAVRTDMTTDGTDVPDDLVRDAVERLLAVVRPHVVRYCRARLGPSKRSSADYIAQEVCLALLKGLPGYRFEGKPFLAFVRSVAAHKVVDAHRASTRLRWHPNDDIPDLGDPTEGPEQHTLRAELVGEMRRLLDELPEAQREILVLRVALGLSAVETAATVGSTPGAVRLAQHRGLAATPSDAHECRDRVGSCPCGRRFAARGRRRERLARDRGMLHQ